MSEIVTSPETLLQLNNSQIVEEEEVPVEIVQYLRRSVKGRSDHTETEYKERCFWVTQICKCLRESYFNIAGITPDSQEFDLGDLWSIQAGNHLHRMIYSYGWRELSIEKQFLCEEIGENLSVLGRLDAYNYKTARIIDLKTSNSIKWQRENGFIPRQSDVLQLLCYGCLFQGILKVSHLTLLYADLKYVLSFRVPIVDMNSWMKERIAELYTSLMIRKAPPPAEPSAACKFCKFKRRCEKLEK